MYPRVDFRFLINQKNVSQEQLIRSLAREPFPELLKFWKLNEKFYELYHVYCQAIEDAIAKDRYPLHQLELILEYPEFKQAVIKGLQRFWLTFRFSLKYNDQVHSLLIDSNEGSTIYFSPKDKLNILADSPKYLKIKETPDNLRVFYSKRSADLCQFFHSF